MSNLVALQRLTLRSVAPGDAAFVLDHYNDPHVRRFLFNGSTVAADQISQTIAESMHNFATAGYGLWLVRKTHDRGAVGAVGLRPLDDLGARDVLQPHSPILGKRLCRRSRLRHRQFALCRLDLKTVYAEIDQANTASTGSSDASG